MEKILKFAFVLFVLALSGCASGGAKYLDLHYTGESDVSRSGKIGISTFGDKRPGIEPGYVGTRYINRSKKEIFYAIGDDVASSVTGICRSYLQDLGFDCTPTAPWEYSPEGVRGSKHGFDYLVGGEIKKLDCFAIKKVGFTSLILDIDMVIYLGTRAKSELKKVPVLLKLERNEITFSKEKLQKFMNESLLEVIQNALSFNAFS